MIMTWAEWEVWRDARAVKSVSDFPPETRPIIEQAIGRLLTTYKARSILLIGSYQKGYWRTTETPVEALQAIFENTGLDGYSDIDLMVYPEPVDFTMEGIDIRPYDPEMTHINLITI